MRISRALAVTAVVAVLTLGSARLLLLPRTTPAAAQAAVATPNFAVGSQYDTTLVFAGVVILSATGVLANAGLRALERRIAPWMHTDTTR